MRDLNTITQRPRLDDRSFRSIVLMKLPSLFLATFVTITLLAVFVPLNPDMPHYGLDYSWVFATNEAVARHLRFGKEFIFTVGPYASIYTRSFHPATDHLMLLGSLLVGMSYITSATYLARGCPPHIVVFLALFCATFPSRDALLLSYPFILGVCALKFVNSEDIQQRTNLSWQHILWIVMAFSALGLLPLIKGSLLFPAGVTTVILGFFLLHRLPLWQTIPVVFIAPASTVFFWMLAGQSVSDIPAFLHGTMLLISGYTDAMSLPIFIDWRPKAIGYGLLFAYIAVVAAVVWSIFSSTQLNLRSKWLMSFLCVTFLSVAFKHGYVRTGNERSAFDTLFMCTLMICFLYADRLLVGSLVLVFALVVVIYIRQDPQLITEVRQAFGVGTTSNETGRLREVLRFISKRLLVSCARITFESTWNTYSAAGKGLRSRLTEGSLQVRFLSALADIRRAYPVPALQGTADIYTVEQSVLLASGNQWKPRPIVQSFVAYTPALARMNEQHLRGSNAPDWVLLDLVTIDDHLPSLDDGLSWPALLENYTFVSFDGQFVLLGRNRVIKTESNWDVIYKETRQTGETVALPETEKPLFAEIDLTPTLLGKALIALYKPPELSIALNLRNGGTKSYRAISNMMVTGFIVSPLVSNTSEFASLAVGNRRFQDDGKVESISVKPSYGGSIFWSGTYILTLKTRGGSPDGGS